ncbi:hypothetical protein LJK88_48975 [Paenibacillus sp. P26]|nr:hypothetical protein LJK88_48975 [Paenibacillus sp. P26]
MPLDQRLRRLFLYIPAAAIVAFAAARWAGMNYLIHLQEYVVPGILFIAAMVHFNHSKGGILPHAEMRD